jgi:Na+/H+ antiporter NhaD/arsenite permease-like protein
MHALYPSITFCVSFIFDDHLQTHAQIVRERVMARVKDRAEEQHREANQDKHIGFYQVYITITTFLAMLLITPLATTPLLFRNLKITHLLTATCTSHSDPLVCFNSFTHAKHPYRIKRRTRESVY